MTSMDICRHCGERIYFEPNAGGYWFHSVTESVWCYEHDPNSPPHTWHLRADPERPPVEIPHA